MGVFNFFKKRKAELTEAQRKENKMWDIWAKGQAGSPYGELMTYQSEINNGGHDQYFTNVENTGDLQKEMIVLETVLSTKLKENLKKAYSIDVKLIELDDKRKVCVPMKTNLTLEL